MSGRFPGIRRVFRLGVWRRETEEELAFHFAQTIEDLTRRGMTRQEATEEARRRFGDERRWRREMERIDRAREASDRWAERLEVTVGGVRDALRRMRRSPAFTLGVVLTFALGIGANATMFGIVDRLLLSAPPHIEAPDGVKRLMVERQSMVNAAREPNEVMSYPDFEDFTRAASFSEVAGLRRRPLTLGQGEEARPVEAHLVTGNFFALLGVKPAIGRFFGPEEDRVGAPGLVVLSHGLWQRAFGGDPDVLGKTIDFGYTPYTVVGVAPGGFTGVDLAAVDLWLPLHAAGAELSGTRWMEARNWYQMRAIARLAPGVGVERAEAEATTLHHAGRASLIAQGDYDARTRVLAAPLIAAQGPLASREVAVAKWLAGLSLIVLLIACANIANLLLARSIRRRREVGIRLALGSSRARILGQVLTEGLLLAALGATAALLMTTWLGEVLRGVLLPDVEWEGATVSTRLLGFTAVLALLAGAFTALVPALQASRPAMLESLKSGSRSGSIQGSRTRDALTVLQTALSLGLLVGAGLFVRSLDRVRSLDLGMEPDRLLLVESTFSAGVPEAQRRQYYQAARERLSALPGVESATASGSVPFWSIWAYEVRVPGLDSLPRMPGGGPYTTVVARDYFTTLGLRLARGRTFTPDDRAGSAPVAIVNRTMARHAWPGEEALGKCFVVIPKPDEETPCLEVVGVVEDVRRFDVVGEPEAMQYYVPLEQGVVGEVTPEALLVRSRDDDPRELIPVIRRELLALEPGLRYVEPQPLRERIAPQVRAWSLGASMLVIFGALALVVAGIGLYSVLAFSVAQRTFELGVRAALGASRGRLVRLVLAKALGLVALGVGLGIAAALLAGGRLAPLLFETSPRDPVVLAGVTGVLLLVAGLSSCFPAWRATRVDPGVALRAE